jgi:hypothetical protein
MSTSETLETRFVVCLNNAGYPASLETRKLYPIIPDAEAAARGHIRVIDESGEDYLYPAEYFAEVRLPHGIEEALLRAS